MNHVGRIEQLSDGIVDELPCLIEPILRVHWFRIVAKIECHALAGVRAIVIQPIISSLPVLLSEDL